MKGFFLATFLFCVVFGIAQFSGTQIQTGPPVQWATVAEGANSRISTPERVILYSQADWQKYYACMAGRTDIQAPTFCDFSKFDLVVIHSGIKMTEANRVYVSTISRPTANQKLIEIVETIPPPNVRMAKKIVHPYVIIRVQKTTGTYAFKSQTFAQMPQILTSGQSCNCGCPVCCSANSGLGVPKINSRELFPPLDHKHESHSE